MKITVRELLDEINEFENDYDPDELNLGTEELNYKSIEVKIKVIRGKNKIFVEGKYSCNVEIKCSRCLERFKDTLEEKFNFEYKIPKEEKYIDITEDVREEIILNYPKKPLCKKECKGLCPLCGKNLNVTECDCERKELDSFNPFSKLANNFND